MKLVEFLPGSRQDFDESFDWYAARSPFLAEEFSAAVDAVIERVAASPAQFALIDAKHRGVMVARFPFRVIYRVESDRVLIVAIARAKRRPRYWRRRETK